MILTGAEIASQQAAGAITIAPFQPSRVKPCSYTYRLGPQLGMPSVVGESVAFATIEIPTTGYVLEPHRMYLGHTLEVLGSDLFAMSLIGRHSLGRLGLFLQVSANLIHVGAKHQITLELVAALPIRLYAGMEIGEISFWDVKGQRRGYAGGYAAHSAPTASGHSSSTYKYQG